VVGSEVAMSKYRCLAGTKGSGRVEMKEKAGNFSVGRRFDCAPVYVVRSSRRASISARAC
jgi:hypothetical protein